MLRNMLVTGLVIGLVGCQVEANPELIEIESARQTFSFDYGNDPGFYTGRMTNYYQTMALTTGSGSNFLPNALSDDGLFYESVTVAGLSFNDVIAIEPGLVSINITTSNTLALGTRAPDIQIHMLDSSSNTLLYQSINSMSFPSVGAKTENFTFFNHASTTASLQLSSLVASSMNIASTLSLDHDQWLEIVDIQTAQVETADWEATTYHYDSDPSESSCQLSNANISSTVSASVVNGKMQLDFVALYNDQPLLEATLTENDSTPGVLSGTAHVQYPALAGIFNASLDNRSPISADLQVTLDGCTLSLEHYRSMPRMNDLQSVKTVNLKAISDLESHNITTIDQLPFNQLSYVPNSTGMQLDVTAQINHIAKQTKDNELALLRFDVNPAAQADMFSVAFDMNMEGFDTQACDSLEVQLVASGANYSYEFKKIRESVRFTSALFRNAGLTHFSIVASASCSSLGDNFALGIDNLVVSNFQKP